MCLPLHHLCDSAAALPLLVLKHYLHHRHDWPLRLGYNSRGDYCARLKREQSKAEHEIGVSSNDIDWFHNLYRCVARFFRDRRYFSSDSGEMASRLYINPREGDGDSITVRSETVLTGVREEALDE